MAPNPGKTFLALPIYGACDPFWFQSMLELAIKKSSEVMVQPNIGDSLVPRSRNALAAAFLQSDCDQLVFIDCDIMFTPEQFKRLCDHPEGIVGGFYFKKQEKIPAAPVSNVTTPVTPPRPDGLQKMLYMGTGFLKIRRYVFEIMRERYRDLIEFRPDEAPPEVRHWDFFPVGLYTYPNGSKRYLSEDWYFCQRAMDCGITIWGDTQIVLRHRGPAVYPLLSQKGRPPFTPEEPVPDANFSLPQAAETAPPAPTDVAASPGDSAGKAERSAAAATAALRGVFEPVSVPCGTISLPQSFIVPPEAADDAAAIMAGCYDVPGLKEAPKTVLDAGAHVGLFSYWALKKWRACVKAFEPVQRNVDAFELNMKEHRPAFTEISWQASALSDHNNLLELHAGRNSLCHSASRALALGFSYSVPCTHAGTIGCFDFVKVDTEGSEVPILTALDLTATKAVVVESHSLEDCAKIKDLMRGKGFMAVSDEPSLGQPDGFRLLKFARQEALLL